MSDNLRQSMFLSSPGFRPGPVGGGPSPSAKPRKASSVKKVDDDDGEIDEGEQVLSYFAKATGSKKKKGGAPRRKKKSDEPVIPLSLREKASFSPPAKEEIKDMNEDPEEVFKMGKNYKKEGSESSGSSLFEKLQGISIKSKGVGW